MNKKIEKSIQKRGNIISFLLVLVIIGGFIVIGVAMGLFSPKDDDGIRSYGGVPYDETPTGKFLTKPSVLIEGGRASTSTLIVTLTISCGNASEMRIQRGVVTSWEDWESYTTIRTIVLGQPNPYFPIYTVSAQFRNGSYISIIVYDTIRYIGENPDLR